MVPKLAWGELENPEDSQFVALVESTFALESNET